MSSILIAFPGSRSALSTKLKEVLSLAGFADITTVTSAADALREMDRRRSGVLITPLQLPDMYYRDLLAYLPDCCSMLLLDTEYNVGALRESDVIALTIPVRTHDLLSTVRMMDEAADRKYQKALRAKKKSRSQAARRSIDAAKATLMTRNHMTEPEAYRYIQKTSMDTGRTMAETARMILLLAGGES